MGIVDDLMVKQSCMAADRSYWEEVWRDVVALFAPYSSRRFDVSGQTVKSSLTGSYQNAPAAAQRSRELYDSTAIWAGERLTAGMESLIAPRSQKWHGLTLDDAFSPDPSDLEEEWLDKTRDYLFEARYDPRCNFALANQKTIRSSTILGTGILYSEENLGARNLSQVKVPFFYRSVPIIDCYLGTDSFDNVDSAIEVRELSARQAVEKFGSDNVSDKVRTAAGDAKKADNRYAFMHAVLPREEAGDYKTKRSGMAYASFWAEIETRHLISDSGFFTFPYSVQWWDQVDGSAYGQSAPMSILSETKMLQAMSKSAVQVAQNLVKPAIATMAGTYNARLNLNPNAVNPGYLTDTGVMKAQPILTGANPSFAERIIEIKRSGIKEGMYLPVFQSLMDNPNMTATESIIRANEKGELLGPAGAKIEHGLAKAVDREVDIIQRKGAFASESPLAPPPSMEGKEVGVKFTGPLARLRRMQELQGVESVLAIAERMGQYDTGVFDRIDMDDTLELAREIRGAPRKMFRTDQEVAASRAEKARMAEQAAAMQAMEGMAGAAGKATPAISAMMQAQAA